ELAEVLKVLHPLVERDAVTDRERSHCGVLRRYTDRVVETRLLVDDREQLLAMREHDLGGALAEPAVRLSRAHERVTEHNRLTEFAGRVERLGRDATCLIVASAVIEGSTERRTQQHRLAAR